MECVTSVISNIAALRLHPHQSVALGGICGRSSPAISAPPRIHRSDHLSPQYSALFCGHPWFFFYHPKLSSCCNFAEVSYHAAFFRGHSRFLSRPPLSHPSPTLSFSFYSLQFSYLILSLVFPLPLYEYSMHLYPQAIRSHPFNPL